MPETQSLRNFALYPEQQTFKEKRDEGKRKGGRPEKHGLLVRARGESLLGDSVS